MSANEPILDQFNPDKRLAETKDIINTGDASEIELNKEITNPSYVDKQAAPNNDGDTFDEPAEYQAVTEAIIVEEPEKKIFFRKVIKTECYIFLRTNNFGLQ